MFTATTIKTAAETNVNSITYSFGNITTNGKSDMPLLEVLANGQVCGYLSPFRKYRFQVSRTIDGECDMGASPILGLKNVLFAQHGEVTGQDSGYCSNYSWYDGSAQTELLYGLALTAVVEMSHGEQINFGKAIYEDCNYYRNTLHKYVNVVAEWLRG